MSAPELTQAHRIVYVITVHTLLHIRISIGILGFKF